MNRTPNCLDRDVDDPRHEWQLTFTDLETGETKGKMFCLKCHRTAFRGQKIEMKPYYSDVEE